jgi:putative CRISPR-associated protein (TIGR02620 family)
MNIIIVSRHPAAIQFIREQLLEQGLDVETIPVLAVATADQLVGKHVYGNLPLQLCAAAAVVTTVEFTGQPPRGLEYSLQEMKAAGARLSSYAVSSVILIWPMSSDELLTGLNRSGDTRLIAAIKEAK